MKSSTVHIHLLIVALLLFSAGCGPQALRVVMPSTEAGLVETRLGESNYYISIPETLRVAEARGKEGQLGYNILAKDPASDLYGFVEIKKGQGIHSGSDTETKPFLRSRLIKDDVVWSVVKTSTGTLTAATNETGDLNARASSKNENGLERMIAIIATLRTK
ncbi:MAG TPA: hypothetical protein PLP21_13640 [Pyrinomonadaceae bacterium]|nr:hypothetical protein [Acidobacteriota bacterium]HQZ97359.1 hypothetical protein [Pyrinomonadaceae bacterium]